jgi:hypothetical protein
MLAPCWSVQNWQRLAEQAKIGESRGGRAWRRWAGRVAARPTDRLLHELIRYLELEGWVTMDTLSNADIFTFSRANETAELIHELLTRAGHYMGYDNPNGPWQANEDAGVWWITFEPPSAAWPAALEGYPELMAVASDDWSDFRLDEPAFGAGWTLSDRALEVLRSTERAAWRNELAEHGFSVSDFLGPTRLFRTLYMAELVPKGARFDRQAQELARWAEEAIQVPLREANLDPGPIDLPERPKSRQRAERATAESEPRSADRRGSWVTF